MHMLPRKAWGAGITKYEPRKFLYGPGSVEPASEAELLEAARVIMKTRNDPEPQVIFLFFKSQIKDCTVRYVFLDLVNKPLVQGKDVSMVLNTSQKARLLIAKNILMSIIEVKAAKEYWTDCSNWDKGHIDGRAEVKLR